MISRCPLALLLACTLATGIAVAERRDHDAHVHGVAAMDVAALGGTVEIVLRSPAMNLVGFEHEPRNDEERKRSRNALASLRDGESLFVFEDAACRLDEVRARWIHEPREHGHDAGHDHEGSHGHADEHGHGEEHRDHGHADEHGHDEDAGDGHADIHAHYHFDCGRVPVTIRVRLFEHFPDTGEIRVQFVTDSAQGAQMLTPASPTLALE